MSMSEACQPSALLATDAAKLTMHVTDVMLCVNSSHHHDKLQARNACMQASKNT